MNISVDQNQIKSVCEEEDINYLALFGSYARGEENKDSDVDMLVNFDEVKSFFQLGRIQIKLEELFNKKVDLVLQKNIKESLKNYIFKDLITLYEKR